MPNNSNVPVTIRKLLINNDENRTRLKQQVNETSVSKLLPTAPRSESLLHPQMSKYNRVNRACDLSRSTPSDSSDVNKVPNNEQSKYLPTDSTSCSTENNTGSTRKKHTTCRTDDLNSQDMASLQFSIQIPIKHLHKLHIDPEQISYETTQLPEHSRQANSTLTDSTKMPALKDYNANLNSKFVKYSFYSSPMDGNILHLKSSVHINETLLRSCNEVKNVAVQSDSIVRDSGNSNSCPGMPIDLSMHARRDLNSYHRVESNLTCNVAPLQTNSDNQELRYGRSPTPFESSSFTNIYLNSRPVQQDSHTAFEESREIFSRNNIIMDHTSSQLNQKGKGIQVSSKYVQTSRETMCSHEQTASSSSENKEPALIHSVHNRSTLKTNNLCDDLVHFKDNSTWSDRGLACALDFTTDWSETSNSEKGGQDYKLSIDDPLKFSNHCQLGTNCSQEGCKCLLWTDSTEKHEHDWNASKPSNHFGQNVTKIHTDSPNQNDLSQVQNHCDIHGKHDSNEQESVVSKPNFILQQMEKERSLEMGGRALQKSKEVRKKRPQKRPSYKLNLDSNFPDNCKFAQHIDRGQPESTQISQVAQNLSHADQASISCLKPNNEQKSGSVEKVHFSRGMNSQILSPLYETSLGQNYKHSFLISSKSPSGQTTHLLQSTAEQKQICTKHSVLEQQLKSKLRYSVEPLKMNTHSLVFEDTFDVHSTAEQYFVLPTEEVVIPKSSTELLSTTCCTDYILTDSTPVTSITPTSSKSCVNPYELHTTLNPLYVQSLQQISETNLHNTNTNLINTTFLNPCVAHWKNNSVTSLCNVSALDVSNEMDQHVQQTTQHRIFSSEMPINTASKKCSSTGCNAVYTSDSDNNMKHIHSNNESVSYPVFLKLKTNANDKLHTCFPFSKSQVPERPVNLHRAKNNCHYSRTSDLKEPSDMLCKNTSVSKQQETSRSEPHPKPVHKVIQKSIAVETHNNPGKVTNKNEHNNSFEKYSHTCHQIPSENTANEVKASKKINVIYKQYNNNCTETVHEHRDEPNIGVLLPSDFTSQLQVRQTPILEIYKNPNLNKQLKVSKPNWDELAITVNELQMICNDHTVPTGQSNSSACNNASETHSILAAQACVETLKKHLGIREQHDNSQ